MLTPWGESDYQTKIADGFYHVGTPSHGGFMIGKAKAVEYLTPEARKRGDEYGSWLCYEEDCQWAMVSYEQAALTHTTHRQPWDMVQEQKAAFECLSGWNPDYLIERGIMPDMDILRRTVQNDKENHATAPENWREWAARRLVASETALRQAEELEAIL